MVWIVTSESICIDSQPMSKLSNIGKWAQLVFGLEIAWEYLNLDLGVRKSRKIFDDLTWTFDWSLYLKPRVFYIPCMLTNNWKGMKVTSILKMSNFSLKGVYIPLPFFFRFVQMSRCIFAHFVFTWYLKCIRVLLKNGFRGRLVYLSQIKMFILFKW